MQSSEEEQRKIVKGAIRLIIVSLVPLISSIATIPLVSEFAFGEPLGSDAAICIIAILGKLLSLKNFFNVRPRDLLAVTFLVLWGTGASSEYNSTGLGVEVFFLGLLAAQISFESRKKVWNLLLLSGICWIRSSLYSLGVALLLFLVPIFHPLQEKYDLPGRRSPIKACILFAAIIVSLLYQLTILAPTAGMGISSYVFHRKEAKTPELFVSALVAILDSVFVHPLLTMLVVILFAASMRFNVKEHFNDDDIEHLLGVVLVRELVMPSPGVSRLGSISTMSSLLACVVLGIILNQCIKRVNRKVGYLLEDYGVEIVLGYVFLGIFQRTLNVTLGLGVTVVIGMTILVLYMFMMLLVGSNVQSPERSVSRLLIISLVWLMFAVASSVLLPIQHSNNSWYDLNSGQQMSQCANQILLGQGRWSPVECSSKFAVSSTHAFFAGETATCRTFYPDNVMDYWKQKKIVVVGDSVGRFVFYSLANKIVSSLYGFPKPGYHEDISASDNLYFRWAPFVNDTLNSTELAGSADLVIVSLGLWDKLYRVRTVQHYGDDAAQFLKSMNSFSTKPKIAWIEMTPTIEQNLISPEKQKNLKEVDAEPWRDQVRNVTSVYEGDISIIPTKHITSGRMSHDGVHYDTHVYMVIAETILRGLY